MSPKRLQRLQEIATAKGKQLLIESFTIPEGKAEVEIFDKTKLVEGTSSEQYTARGVIKNFPIAHFKENRNGRIYPRELFEKIQREGTFNGTNALMDHAGDGTPDGGPAASVKDIAGVWRDFNVGPTHCSATLYCVGEHGQHLIEILKGGGKIFVSLNGFGQLSESDGKTVLPETYELNVMESSADIVLNPSFGNMASASKENLDTEHNKPSLDKVLESSSSGQSIIDSSKIPPESIDNSTQQTGQETVQIKESTETNSNEKVISDGSKDLTDRDRVARSVETKKSLQSYHKKKMVSAIDEKAVTDTAIMENKLKMDNELKMQEAVSAANESTRLQEKNMKHQAELSIKEAMKSANRAEALEKLASVADLISDRPALQETLVKVKAAQEKIQEKLEVELKEKESALSKAQESHTELNTKFAKLTEDHKTLEAKYATAVKMVEKFQKEGSGKGLKEAVAKLAAIKKEKTLMLEDIAAFKEERKKFIETIKKMKEEDGEEWEEPEDGAPYVGEEDSKQEDSKTEVDGDSEMSFTEDDDMSFDDYESEEDEGQEGGEMAEEDEGELDAGEHEVEPYVFDKDEGEEDMSEAEEDDDEDEDMYSDEEDEDMEEAAIRESVKRKMEAMKKAKAVKGKKMSVKEAAKLAATPKKPVQKKSSVNKDVMAFYREAVKVNPSIKDIEKSVLKSKSIKEAYAKVSAFTNKGETKSSVKMKESVGVRTWTTDKMW